jgi:hypothetical protein
MNAIETEVISDINTVLEKVIQTQIGLPAGVVDPVLVKVEGALEAAIGHFGHKSTTSASRDQSGAVLSAQPGSTNPPQAEQPAEVGGGK